MLVMESAALSSSVAMLVESLSQLRSFDENERERESLASIQSVQKRRHPTKSSLELIARERMEMGNRAHTSVPEMVRRGESLCDSSFCTLISCSRIDRTLDTTENRDVWWQVGRGFGDGGRGVAERFVKGFVRAWGSFWLRA